MFQKLLKNANVQVAPSAGVERLSQSQRGGMLGLIEPDLAAARQRDPGDRTPAGVLDLCAGGSAKISALRKSLNLESKDKAEHHE